MDRSSFRLQGVALGEPVLRQVETPKRANRSGPDRYQATFEVLVRGSAYPVYLDSRRRRDLERRVSGVRRGVPVALEGQLWGQTIRAGTSVFHVVAPKAMRAQMGPSVCEADAPEVPEFPLPLAEFVVTGTVETEPKVRSRGKGPRRRADVVVHVRGREIPVVVSERDRAHLDRRLSRLNPGCQVEIWGTLAARRQDLGISELVTVTCHAREIRAEAAPESRRLPVEVAPVPLPEPDPLARLVASSADAPPADSPDAEASKAA